MIAIVDYGSGNVQSVQNAFAFLKEESVLTSSASEIEAASHVVLPGVGSFADAMGALNESGLAGCVKAAALSGKPFLGICLGLQLLFEKSSESPGVAGLGVLKGEIVKIPNKDGLKVPHVGWNSLCTNSAHSLFSGVDDGSFVYFVHSYYLQASDKSLVSATTSYGVEIECAVQKGKLCATQFHPEKSAAVGLQILKNFVALGD